MEKQNLDQDRQIKRLLKYFESFQFTDLLGFAKILEVEEQEDFVEFIVNIVDSFQQQDKKKRKELIKLAKDVSEFNLKD